MALHMGQGLIKINAICNILMASDSISQVVGLQGTKQMQWFQLTDIRIAGIMCSIWDLACKRFPDSSDGHTGKQRAAWWLP